MTIKNKDPLAKVIIDCTGPSGTAVSLVGQAALWLKWQGKSNIEIGNIIGAMLSVDYNHIIKIFDQQFGKFCDLIK